MVLSALEKSKARKGDRDCQGGDTQFFMAWAERPQPGQWLLNQESDCEQRQFCICTSLVPYICNCLENNL